MAMFILTVPAVAAQSSEVSEPGLRLIVSIPERTLALYDGDELVRRYDVAVGKETNPTPTGTFKMRKIIWNPAWVPPPGAKWAKGKTAKEPGHPDNPMKKVKIFFKEPDYYIHGTGDEDSMGHAASHGCIRMIPDEAAEVAKYVMEHGGSPRPENWFRRVLRLRRTSVVYLKNPVTLQITREEQVAKK
jgi:L,D-transpeptidase ErfK/SrfK